jgi:hypothetical protein
MNRYDQKLFQLFIFLMFFMEKVFGLSSFRYKNKRIRALTLSTRVIIISFIILYPISCARTLDFSHSNDSAVTIRARNLTFVFKWLLLCFVHGNGILNENYDGFNDIERMLRGLIKRQNFNDNLMLLLRCTTKVTVIFSGLFFLNYRVINIHSCGNLMTWEKVLALLLHLPLITFALASNRIYVANVIVKQFLLMNANGLKTGKLQMNNFAVMHSRLHEFFTKFNNFNSINLLSVVCFCVLNIVYQVK